MFPPLLPFEEQILLWINGHHCSFLDAFMFMISNLPAWLPLLFVLLYWLFYKKPWQETFLLLLFVTLIILLGDQLSSGFAKPFFARFRPTHTAGLKEQLHIVFNYTGREYGFFSGHATNFFSVVLFLSLVVRERKFSIMLFSLVALVCYSRMYMGVHYLSDIIGGVIVGGLVAYLFYQLYAYCRKKFLPTGYKTSKEIFAFGLSFVMIALYSFLPVLSAYALAVVKILKRI